MPHLHELSGHLLEALSPEAFGIPWLGVADAGTRVLISDFIVAAAETVEVSMVDAAVSHRSWRHLFSGEAAEELHRRFTREPIPDLAPVRDFPLVMADRELAAFFVAIGSAFDRFGICIAGLVGLPVRLRRTDWREASRVAMEIVGSRGELGTADALGRIGFPIEDGGFGPQGWLDWTLAMRNNFVHRPRRWSISPGRGVSCLPRDPDKTDVETARDSDGFNGMLLTENAVESLGGVIVSSAELIEHLSELLIGLCLARANGELAIDQPGERQWPDVGAHSLFTGYAPGTVDLDAQFRQGAIVMSPSMGLRLIAAGLTDDRRRDVWS